MGVMGVHWFAWMYIDAHGCACVCMGVHGCVCYPARKASCVACELGMPGSALVAVGLCVCVLLVTLCAVRVCNKNVPGSALVAVGLAYDCSYE
jgi:hypothetical protein